MRSDAQDSRDGVLGGQLNLPQNFLRQEIRPSLPGGGLRRIPLYQVPVGKEGASSAMASGASNIRSKVHIEIIL